MFVTCQAVTPSPRKKKGGEETTHLPDLPPLCENTPIRPLFTWTTMHKPQPHTPDYPRQQFDSSISCGPHPLQFIAGSLVTSLRSPNPTTVEMTECSQIMESAQWKDLANGLIKWNGRQYITGFRGTANVSELLSWKDALKKFFRI